MTARVLALHVKHARHLDEAVVAQLATIPLLLLDPLGELHDAQCLPVCHGSAPRWLVGSELAAFAVAEWSNEQWHRIEAGQPSHASVRDAIVWWTRLTGRSDDALIVGTDDAFVADVAWRTIIPADASAELAAAVAASRAEPIRHGAVCFSDRGDPNWLVQGLRWFDALPPTSMGTDFDNLGATALTESSTQFCVWAPRRKQVEVVTTDQKRFRLNRDRDGYHTGVAPVGPGERYLYKLDGEQTRPDPAARFQPGTVHDHSEIVSPVDFCWTDTDWSGVAKRDLVIYELHLGAFSHEGTYRGALERLPYLRELGITAIELLPLAQTPGRWNWGYDGVGQFALNANYGSRADFKALVDACHQQGIAVLLDVVYNHLGPEGNYLAEFGPYFSKRRHTPWGGALNFDGWLSKDVRRWILENVRYWIEEFHLDGLRLDAVHFMFDDGEQHILQAIRNEVTGLQSTTGRELHLIGESNMYDASLLQPNPPEQPFDAVWCDCLMHSIYSHGTPDVRLTYRDYTGAQDVHESLEHGYLYVAGDRLEGDPSCPEPKRTTKAERRQRHDSERAAPSLPLDYLQSLVISLQTHDSVGNHPHGKRLHQLTSVAFHQAAATLVLMYPSIPMLFMGEESAADAPFPFFADFGDPDLRRRVDEGRAREYPHHQWDGAVAPSDPRAFWQAKCDLDGPSSPETLTWYQSLLRVRREGIEAGWLNTDCFRPTVAVDGSSRFTVHGGAQLFEFRYQSDSHHIQVLVTLAPESHGDAAPVMELAPNGRVLLNSRPAQDTNRREDEPITLWANHAIIVAQESAKT